MFVCWAEKRGATTELARRSVRGGKVQCSNSTSPGTSSMVGSFQPVCRPARCNRPSSGSVRRPLLAGRGGSLAAATEAQTQVDDALADDLNTPLVLGSLSAPLKAMNDLLGTKKGRKAAGRLVALRQLHETVESSLAVLGISTKDPAGELATLRAAALLRAGLTQAELDAKVAERAAARAEKDFARSDALRDELASAGIMLMDGGGAAWRPGVPASTLD